MSYCDKHLAMVNLRLRMRCINACRDVVLREDNVSSALALNVGTSSVGALNYTFMGLILRTRLAMDCA